MGRQINFYMSESVEKEFFELLSIQGYKILYDGYDVDSIQELTSYDGMDRKKWLIILYKDFYGPLIYADREEKEINRNYSPVIEWSRTIINNNEKFIREGRIWISSWVEFEDSLIEEQFKKDYNSLVRWIKKKVPREEYTWKGHILKRYKNTELQEYEDKGYDFR